MGVRKIAKMEKNGNFGRNRQKKYKKDKKMKEFLISYLKSMPLHFTHHIIPEKNEKMPRGGQWECTKVEKAIFPF